MPSKRSSASVLGGSLTRSPEGRLQTLQTHGMYPSPQSVQEVWSNTTRRRYPKAWEGQRLEPHGHTIEWEPRAIACGSCGHSLGTYAAYRVIYADATIRGEQGVVEDTARRYERQAQLARGQAGSRGPRARPRFWLTGEIGRRAAKTTACFHCPGCQRDYERNLARLGQRLFESRRESAYLLE
jgi:hypothetical protein